MFKGKKEIIINNVNVAELEYTKLLKFSQSLYNELIRERKIKSLQQVDKDQKMVFLSNIKNNAMKTPEYDVKKTAEQNARRIDDLEKHLRGQRAYYDNGHDNNLENIRLQNDEVQRKISSQFEKQITELFDANLSLQHDLEKQDVQHRDEINTIRENNSMLIDEKMEMLEEQMVELLMRMEDRRTRMFRQVDEQHIVELQSYQSINERNIKYTTERYNSEIARLIKHYNYKYEKLIAFTQSLKDSIQNIDNKNTYLNQYVLDTEEENEKLNDDLRATESDNQYLQRKADNFDRCVRKSSSIMKELKKYEHLFKLKREENEMLEKNNTEMRQAFGMINDDCT